MSEAIKKKIAINTGGGDAQVLNAVIHGAVYAARGLGCKVVRIHRRSWLHGPACDRKYLTHDCAPIVVVIMHSLPCIYKRLEFFVALLAIRAL